MFILWDRMFGTFQEELADDLEKQIERAYWLLFSRAPTEQEQKFFDQAKMDELKDRQVKTIQYLDTVLEELFDMVPDNTYITVTADHGELFGEDGYFGHGPIMHEKVFEVPFVEGKLR